MAYQALYREYRPKCFGEVIGQSHITSILKNQVQQGRASHAYLFCGSRGTGKTSTAKIFARAVNCSEPVDGEACGHCEACGAMREEAVDIIEIDAASNNGVDDVRALIEQARFTPLRLKYKVYIIDEVHMLSGAASNALLKTLEEPPEHVIFLLATTEPQKLLATVISRCQRFDFKRLSVKDIVSTLNGILVKIGAAIEPEGLLTIARTADGGMRDALSLADQCLAFCGKDVSARDVNDVLGGMDSDFLFNMTDALIDSSPADALRMLDEIVRGGKDLLVFSQDLCEHMRAVLLAKECGDCHELLDCTQETMRLYEAQASRSSEQRLLRALELMAKAQNEMKWLGRPRILLEATLVSICRPEDESTIAALTDRVDRLEQLLLNAEAGKPAAGNKKPEKQPEKKPEKKKNRPDTQIWDALKSAIQKYSSPLYVVSFGVERAECDNGTLTLYFPEAKRNNYDMFVRHQSQIQERLDEISPGMKLCMKLCNKLSANGTSDAQTNELREIFGDKLKIT